jgi:hypothetical protein
VYDRQGRPIKDGKPQHQARATRLAPNDGPRFEADMLTLQRTAGNRAAWLMLMRQSAGPMSPATGAAVTGTSEVDVSMKDDPILARGIVDGELRILRQWRDALLIFDKTMVSESDEAGKPDFQKATLQYFDASICALEEACSPSSAL